MNDDKHIIDMVNMTKRLWNFMLMAIISVGLLIVYSIGINYDFIPDWLIIGLSIIGGATVVIGIDFMVLLMFDRDDMIGDEDDNIDDLIEGEHAHIFGTEYNKHKEDK